ncbi:hypothetical protein V6N13_081231 [Hibiscus sabdariffa]
MEFDVITAHRAQISSLENKIKNMEGTSEVAPIQLVQQNNVFVFSCEICGENHSYEDRAQDTKTTSYAYNMQGNEYENSYNVATHQSKGNSNLW